MSGKTGGVRVAEFDPVGAGAGAGSTRPRGQDSLGTAGHITICGTGQCRVTGIHELALTLGHQEEGFLLLGGGVFARQAVGIVAVIRFKRRCVIDGFKITLVSFFKIEL